MVRASFHQSDFLGYVKAMFDLVLFAYRAASLDFEKNAQCVVVKWKSIDIKKRPKVKVTRPWYSNSNQCCYCTVTINGRESIIGFAWRV
jgi:hypothetical protein